MYKVTVDSKMIKVNSHLSRDDKSEKMWFNISFIITKKLTSRII